MRSRRRSTGGRRGGRCARGLAAWARVSGSRAPPRSTSTTSPSSTAARRTSTARAAALRRWRTARRQRTLSLSTWTRSSRATT
eukprot:4016875-Prymnesium_polylepis.1